MNYVIRNAKIEDMQGVMRAFQRLWSFIINLIFLGEWGQS